MEEQARREEKLFIRAPVTKAEKKREKHLKKSRNGLLGLTDSCYDEIKALPMEDETGEEMSGFGNNSNGVGRFKKRKRKY